MADIEKFDDFPEDFGLTEADLANFDPDDPDFEDPFKEELPLELQDEVKVLAHDEPTIESVSKGTDRGDVLQELGSTETKVDASHSVKDPVEQFEEFDVDYSIEDDPFPELDEEEVNPLPNESKKEVTTVAVVNEKLNRKPGEVEDGELDSGLAKSTKRNSEGKSNTAQGTNTYRARGNQIPNQRRGPMNNEGFQPGMRFMPYRPVNGMMPGMRPFPSGTIHVNPNFRGFQQRPPFPMNPVSSFGVPMMGMRPWMMNGRGYNGARPGFGMEFNHKQGKPSDTNNSLSRKNPPMNRNRDQKPDREQESKKNGSSGKRAYTSNTHDSFEERKKHHSNNGPKQQNNLKVDSSVNRKHPEVQPQASTTPTNTKGVRVVVSNIASSVSRPQLIEMADSIKKGSIQSVVIDRRSNQAEMIFQTTDSAKMFRRKFHRSALADNHITVNIS